MIKIGMCDDELNNITTIAKIIESSIIESDFDAEISTITNNQDVICELISQRKLDVLILDIDFGKNQKNGMEFAKELRKLNKDFYLVFLSAHPRYMHMSFVNKTFDYLVKPIHPNAILDFVKRLKEEFEQTNKLFIQINKSLSLRSDDILYIEKQGSKAYVYTSSSTYSVTKTLENLIKILPNNFIRCHRSYIVNKEKILSIDKKDCKICLGKNIFCPTTPQYFGK